MTPAPSLDTITLAGGCFWCTEAAFLALQGVHRVESGYANGHVEAPTYEAVCTGRTGHAEVVQVQFDPQTLPLEGLLAVFFTVHDPTTLNRQGADVGTQYRSGIYWHHEAQAAVAQRFIAQLEADRVFPDPIVTEVAPLDRYHPAEAEHQNYHARHPWQGYCQWVIAPKLAKLRARHAPLLR